MRAIDHTSGRVLAGTVSVAESFLARLKGLLGRDRLPPGQALWIKPCNSVHTFGMKFPIDVAFLDREQRVVALVTTLAPNRISGYHPTASSVLELPAGTLDLTATVVGNKIEIA
ncbi:DUF192 domain-containing protein [Geomonas oryzisoli]|uniref:DUF192 domain-containing protein n=1 Tax=Geomonas oryzisoli TaxID=2847992 RepID=A0ABX8JEJ1_9BACT|nr:DUF192 domain-containing protein [Geomonas oryzisoli]QWV95112.1 DUF192 domain-containing protein [Geomonas oryzisoli]